jgi:hypothetical protein
VTTAATAVGLYSDTVVLRCNTRVLADLQLDQELATARNA